MILFPTPAAHLSGSSIPSFRFSPLAGVLEDAKNKAKSLEEQAKSGASDLSNKASSTASDAANKARDLQSRASNAASSAAANKGGIVLYSPQFYGACMVGGALACGTTHAFVTPLDLVKCRRQVDKNLYKGNMDGWRKIWTTEGGMRGIYTGFGATLVGYSIQGAGKFGLYEVFKKYYADLAGEENAKKYKDLIYVAGSASAEFFADMGLVPLEAVKVRTQTTIPPFAKSVFVAMPRFVKQEGVGGLFKSLPSLWGRQIPYTVMKFWAFEATVAKIYSTFLSKPRDQYNKVQQLGVSFLGGYIAGVFCAVVSHPADTMVSKLNAPVKEGGAKPTVGTIYKEIGFGGLWAGLGTRIIMVGTLTALQWFIYDSWKVYMGFPTTGAESKPQQK